MRIVNLNNGASLADKACLAGTFLARFKGLMGRSALSPGEALVIKPCNSVHTFFMKFPIDLLFLDENYVVLKTMENVKPFRLSPVVKKSRMVVELPAGLLAATGTRAGDRLSLFNKEESK